MRPVAIVLSVVPVLACANALPPTPSAKQITTGPTNSMQTFTSQDGTEIACERSGGGSPLVLVHGTSADHGRWAPVLSELQRAFTVYACDRRGRGGSGDTEPYAIEREFEDIAAVIDGIGGPVDVVAHSYGALCALEAAARARNLRRLVLYEPPIPIGEPIYAPDVLAELERLLAAGDRDGVVSTFMREIPRVPPDQLALMKTLPAWSRRVAAAHTIVRELYAHEAYSFDPARLRAITAPTLLLLGGESPAFFAEGLERVRQSVPHAELVVLPGQTHVAIDTAPDLFTREVLTFLRE